MSTLYWITVLGNLCTLSGWTLGILIVAILLLGTYAIATATGDYADEDDKAEARKYYLDKHDKMIRKEIDDEIAALNKEIEEL